MSSSSKKITLRSSDGQQYEVDEVVALESQTIKRMIDEDCVGDGIRVPNVTGKILSKVIEYCKKHAKAPKDDDKLFSLNPFNAELKAWDAGMLFSLAPVDAELKAWDADFVKVDQNTLFDLILAANYLNIKGLMDLTCLTVANMMKGKSVEEVRKLFNIKNDFTPEEEAEVRRENQWAFD